MKKSMILVISSVFCALTPFNGVQAAERSVGAVENKNEPVIRVLLGKDIRGALLEARGPYKVVDRDRKELLTYEKEGKRFVMHAIPNGLRWGEEYPDVYSVSIVPMSPTTAIYVDGMQYKGSLHVFSAKRGVVTIINEAPLEAFVSSTLSLKLATTLSTEAMAAMAIAARTNAYAHIFYRNEATALWDISAKEAGYLGMGVTLGKNGVDTAVAQTRNIVLEEGHLPLRDISLSPEEAEKLAAKGLDAKKILRNAVPRGEIGSYLKMEGKEKKA